MRGICPFSLSKKSALRQTFSTGCAASRFCRRPLAFPLFRTYVSSLGHGPQPSLSHRVIQRGMRILPLQVAKDIVILLDCVLIMIIIRAIGLVKDTKMYVVKGK